MTRIEKLLELPSPSTELVGPVELHDSGENLRIVFPFPQSTTGIVELGFSRVRAYRHLAEVHSSASQIESSYDALVEVLESRWVEEVRASTPERWRGRWVIRHFMIYADSNGVYDVLAESWSSTIASNRTEFR